jgi:hypothetical protein
MVSVPHLKADFALRLNQSAAVFACSPAVPSAVSSPVPPLFWRIRKITNKTLISIEKLMWRVGSNSGGKKFRRVTGDNSGERTPAAGKLPRADRYSVQVEPKMVISEHRSAGNRHLQAGMG